MFVPTAGLLWLAFTALAAVVQAGGSFFSDDAVGFIKVIVFFGGGWLVIIATVVKFSQSGLKSDLTNIGTKVDNKFKEYDAGLSRLDARIANNEKEITGTARDVTTLITANATEFNRQFNELSVELARMQERDKLATSLDRFRDEIRDELRGGGRDRGRDGGGGDRERK